jgi:hypothetical protein
LPDALNCPLFSMNTRYPKTSLGLVKSRFCEKAKGRLKKNTESKINLMS